MKKLSKKALSIFLMMLLVFGAIPVQSNAVDPGLEISAHGTDQTTVLPSKLDDGQIWSDKSVTDHGDGSFTVKLKAMGQEYEAKELVSKFVDVVLVLDTSGSMSGTKLANMKTAAKNAVDNIIDAGAGNRVAVVEYSRMASKVHDFSRNINTLKGNNNSGIEGLKAGGGTNIQNGLLVAENLIKARTNSLNKAVIILLSDGQPTYYHESYTNQTGSTNTSGVVYGYNRKGSGSEATAEHVKWTISQAAKAKENIADLEIYTIGFDVNGISPVTQRNFAIATLKPTSSNTSSYFTWQTKYGYWDGSTLVAGTSASDILNAFNGIVDTITSKGNPLDGDFVIEDVLGNGFVIDGALPAGLSLNGNKVTWTIAKNNFKLMEEGSQSIDPSKINEIEFKVKISDSVGAGTYLTNASAKAAFKVVDDNPFYKNQSKTRNENLPNKGWLTLVEKNLEVLINVTKKVTGPNGWNDNSPRTFNFNFYYSDPSQGGVAAIVSAPLLVTVNGPGTKTEQQLLSIPASQFKNNKITIYVKENNTEPTYWTYDSVKSVTINKFSPTGTVVFVNNYNPKGSLTVTKDWQGDGPQDTVKFKLQKRSNYGSWSDVSTGHTLSAPSWTATIGGLSLGTKYRVVEDSMANYAVSYNPADLTFDANNLNKTITITNKYNAPKGQISVSKIWNDNDNSADARPEQLVFNYTGPSGVSGQLVLKAEDNWTNLLETAVWGSYTFTEQLPADYTVDQASKTATISIEPGNRNAALSFTNTYVEPKGKLTVSKSWVGDQGNENYRPSTVNIEIFKDGESAGTASLPKSGENPWKHTFEGLDFGAYTVVESSESDDYTVSYSDDVNLSKDNRSDGITVTNTFKNPKGSIDISKIWVESGVNPSAVRPSSITVSLLKNGSEIDSVTLPKPGGSLIHKFTGLSLDGSVYTVSESSEESAKLGQYDTNISYSGDSANGISLTKNNREGNATITNTYASGTITVVKNWNDGSNPEGDRPNGATVTLYKRVKTTETTGEIIDEGDGEEVLVPKTVTVILTETVGTKFIPRPDNAVVFYDLEMGEDISYYVVENAIPFYDTTYSNDPDNPAKYLVLGEDAQNGQLSVTNTYTDPKGSLTVVKDWRHGNNPQGPSEVTVQLKADGQNDGQPVTFTGSHTFSGLDLGKTYTVVETAITNYGTAYSGNLEYTPIKGASSVADGQVTITNTYIPETGSLEVNKVWDGKVGDPVTIIITRSYDNGEGEGIADSEFTRTFELNSENDWKETLTGLEIYGPEGKPYSYSAQETGDLVLYKVTNNDTPTLNSGTKAVITITNKYTPLKGSLLIEKEWLDINGRPMNPPAGDIEVRLLINGKGEESTMVLNAENDWTLVRDNLDVDKTYAVEEVTGHEEFDVSYSNVGPISFNSNSLRAEITITNTENPNNPRLKVEKLIEKDSAVLIDGKATFNYTVNIKNTGNRTLSTLILLDVMTGPEGATMTYDPVPDRIFSDGVIMYELEGSFPPGATRTVHYSITVDKAGDYHNLAEGNAWFGDDRISCMDEKDANVKAPGLSIIKSIIGPDLISGSTGTFTYQLLIRNDGETTLYDVKVKDLLEGNPEALYEYSGSYDFDPETRVFTIGTLENDGEDIIITYNVTFNQAGIYNNNATVSGWFDTDEYDEMDNPIREELTDSDDATVQLKKPSRPPVGPEDPEGPTDPIDPTDPKDPADPGDDGTGIEGDQDKDIEDEETGILGDKERDEDEAGLAGDKDTPKTGDDTSIALFVFLLAASGAGIVGLRRRRGKVVQ